MSNLNTNINVGFSKTTTRTAILSIGTFAANFFPKLMKNPDIDADKLFVYTDSPQFIDMQRAVGDQPRLSYICCKPTEKTRQSWVAMGNNDPGIEGLGGNAQYAAHVFTAQDEDILRPFFVDGEGKPKYELVWIAGAPYGASYGERAELYADFIKSLGIRVTISIVTLEPPLFKLEHETTNGEKRDHAIDIIESMTSDGNSVITIDAQEVVEHIGEEISVVDMTNAVDKKICDIIADLSNKIDAPRRDGWDTKGNLNDTDVQEYNKTGGHVAAFTAFSKNGNVGEIIAQMKKTNYLYNPVVSGQLEGRRMVVFIEGRELLNEEVNRIFSLFSSLGIMTNKTAMKDRIESNDNVDYLRMSVYFMQMEEASAVQRTTSFQAKDFGNTSDMSIEMQLQQLQAENESLKASQPIVAAFDDNRAVYSSYLSEDKKTIQAGKLTEEVLSSINEIRVSKNREPLKII
jgi:cell division GTPase FtsZ